MEHVNMQTEKLTAYFVHFVYFAFVNKDPVKVCAWTSEKVVL